MQSIKSIEDAWNEGNVKVEPDNVEEMPETMIEQSTTQIHEPTPYVTRYGRISRPPSRLIETAYAVLNETYIQNYQDIGSEELKDTVECTYAMKALLFQKALQF